MDLNRECPFLLWYNRRHASLPPASTSGDGQPDPDARTMTASRIITACTIAAIGVYFTIQLEVYGLAVQLLPLIAGLSTAAVILVGGWHGARLLVFTHASVLVCCGALLWIANAIHTPSTPSRPVNPVPPLLVGLFFGCASGIHLSRKMNSDAAAQENESDVTSAALPVPVTCGVIIDLVLLLLLLLLIL